MLPLQKDQKDMKLVAMKRRMKDDAVDEGDKEIEGLADMFAEEEAENQAAKRQLESGAGPVENKAAQVESRAEKHGAMTWKRRNNQNIQG